MLYMTEMAKGRAVRPESKNMAQKQLGFPRNLGDPVVSTGTRRPWGGRTPTLQACRCCVLGDGSESRRTEWYRQAKATKCGGRAGRKSQRLIVPMIQGNLYRGDPGREGGNFARNRGQDTRRGLRASSTVSTKCPRIARREVKPCREEPYALNAHVRICGSPGWETIRGHPAADRFYEMRHVDYSGRSA
jgi:hypothetical protein